MLKLHMFQPQVAETTKDGKIVQPWLPYSTAILWAYAQDHDNIKKNYTLEKLHYLRLPIDEVIESIDSPDVAAFSCYMWNENYNLELAKRIKQKWPDCKIIFGGPQTGSNHLKHHFIDVRIYGEGESAFLEILRSINNNEKLEPIYRSKRLKELTWSSPYLLGLFDDIIKDAPDNYRFQTVLETTRGCPYQCTFCDWGELGSKIHKFDLDRVEKEIKWIANNPISVIFLGDANFGVLKDRDMEVAKLIKKYTKGSKLEYIAVSFLKNSNRSIFEIMKEIGHLTKSVSLSLQSLNKNTLKAIKRDNMKSNNLEEMLRLSKEYNVPTMTDMIIGLPMETLQSWKEGLARLLEMGNDGFIEANFTGVLVNAELSQKQIFEYNMKTVEVDVVQDDSGIAEKMEIVVSTNTMSRADMAEAWLWNWIIRFFHSAGYTNILSKYYNKVHNGSYYDFYQVILNQLRSGNGKIEKEFLRIERATNTMLATGKLSEGIDHIYDFYITSYPVIYENINELFEMLEYVMKSMNIYDETIMNLQRRLVINKHYPPIVGLKTNYNIDSWEEKETYYDIIPRNPSFKGTYNEFQFLRRSSNWKNNIIQKPLTSVV